MASPAPRLLARLLLGLGVLAASGCEVDVLNPGAADAGRRPVDAGFAPRPDARPLDAGVAEDAASAPDADPADAADPDAGAEPDAGTMDAGTMDAGAPIICDFETALDPAAARTVLIGHPFGAMIGQAGTEIRSLRLDPSGDLVDVGTRLDVGQRAARIAFTPSGALALVLGEDGRLVSVAVDAPDRLRVIDGVDLPRAGYGDLHLGAAGRIAWATGSNVDVSSGVSAIHVSCDGRLSVDAPAYLNVRLAESLAVLPGEQRAVLLGGQTVFAPIDPNDLRLLTRAGAGWVELAGFDIWMDFVDASRIAVSPDGATLVVPNRSVLSTEGGQVLVAGLVGDTIVETQRLMMQGDVSEVLFSPDGETVLISAGEGNRVQVFRHQAGRLTATTSLRGVGLADGMAMVERGPLAGTVLVPSVDPNGGPNIAILSITGPGTVSDRGQLELGSGSVQIPGPIGLVP